MGTTTKISWTDKTWNPAVGCTKVVLRNEAGVPVPTECKNCYMYRDQGEIHKMNVQNPTRTKPGTFNAPLKWNREAAGY